MECGGVFPTPLLIGSSLIGKVWIPVMHFCVSHTLQNALESWQEARIVQIDFSAALNRVNHQGILYKLCSVGIGCSVLSILTQFPSNRSQDVMEDGCHSKLVLTSCQECHREVFWACYCFSCTPRIFFQFWRIS